MKKILFVTIVCLLLIALPVCAKEDNALINNSGGGGMVEVLQIDTTNLNSLLVENGYSALDSKMITFGGGLLAQTRDNIRYSNFGAFGSMSSTAENGQYACLSFSHGGVWVDKIFPFTKAAAVSLGGSGSVGKLKLELVRDKANDFGDGVENTYQTVMSVPVFMVKPQVGIYYSLKRYIDLEVKAGYYYSHTIGSWKMGKQSLSGEQSLQQMHGLSLLVNLNFGF